MVKKIYNSVFSIYLLFKIKNYPYSKDQKSRKLSFDKKIFFSFFSGNNSEISIVNLFLDASEILWKKS